MNLMRRRQSPHRWMAPRGGGSASSAGRALSVAVLCTAGMVLAACAQPIANERVELFQSMGSRQCSGGGRTLAALVDPLRAAGVEVLRAECGHDGRMRVALCGAADGRIAIVEIRPAQLAQAQALGFSPLRQLPQAHRVADCR